MVRVDGPDCRLKGFIASIATGTIHAGKSLASSENLAKLRMKGIFRRNFCVAEGRKMLTSKCSRGWRVRGQ